MRRIRFALALGLLSCLPLSLFAADRGCADPAGTTVYVVRHAERAEDGTGDPPLSPDGQARAQALRAALSDIPLAAVHTTQLQRTVLTAGPVARANGLEIHQHPIASGEAESHSAALAEYLVRHHCGEQVLVVGHSNTVPMIVSALTGRPEPELSELDYDFLYQVRLMPDGEALLLRSRYGRSNRTAYRVHWQGALRDFHHGDHRGRVPLDSLADWPGLYAAGPLAGMGGEVTVIDGQWYLTRVENGAMATERVARGEAGFLVWSEVLAWQEPVTVDRSIDGLSELDRLVDRLAREHGIDTLRPFPFRLIDAPADLTVHVLAPAESPDAGHLDSALVTRREGESVNLIGFFSSDHAGVFTHRGSRIHVHALLPEGHGAHVDRLRLIAPFKLSLPVVH